MTTKAKSFLTLKNALITLLIATPILYIGVGCVDSQKKEYPNLMLTPRSAIPAKDNALTEITLAIAKITNAKQWDDFNWNNKITSNDGKISKEIPKSEWRIILEQNKEALHHLDLSFTKTQFHQPHNFMFDDQCTFIEAIKLHRLLGIRIINKAKEGNWQSAFTDLENFKKFPRLLYSMDDTLVGSLVGVAIDATRLNTIEYLLNHHQLDERQLRKLLQLTQTDTAHLHQAMSRAMKAEFLVHVNAINFIAAGGDKSSSNFPFYFHKNRTIDIIAKIQTVALEASLMRPQEASEHLKTIDLTTLQLAKNDKYWAKITPNSTGKIYTATTSPIIGEQPIKAYQTDVIQDLLQLKIANKIYSLKHSSNAPTVDILHQILGKELSDPYASNEQTPYCYDPTRGVLWSIGIDFVDDKGKEPKDFFDNSATHKDYQIFLTPINTSN